MTERIDHYFRKEDPIVINSIKEEVARWVNMGSGWVIDSVKTVYVDFARYQAIRGGTYAHKHQKQRQLVPTMGLTSGTIFYFGCEAHRQTEQIFYK